MLPLGQTWLAHDGKKARIRRLRQICKPILCTEHPGTVELIKRARKLTADINEPEYGLLHILAKAKEASNDTGESIEDSLSFMLDVYEFRDKDQETTPKVVKE